MAKKKPAPTSATLFVVPTLIAVDSDGVGHHVAFNPTAIRNGKVRICVPELGIDQELSLVQLTAEAPTDEE